MERGRRRSGFAPEDFGVSNDGAGSVMVHEIALNTEIQRQRKLRSARCSFGVRELCYRFRVGALGNGKGGSGGSRAEGKSGSKGSRAEGKSGSRDPALQRGSTFRQLPSPARPDGATLPSVARGRIVEISQFSASSPQNKKGPRHFASEKGLGLARAVMVDRSPFCFCRSAAEAERHRATACLEDRTIRVHQSEKLGFAHDSRVEEKHR